MEELRKRWNYMRKRARERGDSCNVCPEWLVFENFRDWALHNGFLDNLVLCRNGDEGDYSPTNCRWDTNHSNRIEAEAEHWVAVSPDDEEIPVYNMAAFCREHKLDVGTMCKIASDKYPHYQSIHG